MRKLARLAAVLTALALVAGACGGDDDDGGGNDGTGGNTVEQGRALKTVAPGKLTVCTDMPYAPFEFTDDSGQVRGIGVDLVKAITGRLGLSAEFKDTDFEGIFAALSAGQCDIIASSVSITEDRKKNNLFSEGYFRIHQSLLVRKGDEAKYKDLASLRGRNVGVQSATTGADFAKAKAEGANVREFTAADEMFTALRANQIDAILQDEPVNTYNAKTTGQTVVSKVFTEEPPEDYGFVIPKGRDDLKKAIDDALRQIRSDDTYRTILTNYLGTTANQ